MKTIQNILALWILFEVTASEFRHRKELQEQKNGRRVRRQAESSTGYDLSLYSPPTVSYFTNTNVYSFPATHTDDFSFISLVSGAVETSGTLVDPFSNTIHILDSEVTTASFSDETSKTLGYTSMSYMFASSASDYHPLTSVENRITAIAPSESISLINTSTSNPHVLDSPVATLSVFPSLSNKEVFVQLTSSIWTINEVANVTPYMEDTRYVTNVLQLISDSITEAFLILHSAVQSHVSDIFSANSIDADFNSSIIYTGFMTSTTPGLSTLTNGLESVQNPLPSNKFISTSPKSDFLTEVTSNTDSVISTSWISLETSERLFSYPSWPSLSIDSGILMHTDLDMSSYSILGITLTTQVTPELISSNNNKYILSTDTFGNVPDVPLTFSDNSLFQDMQNSTFQPSDGLSSVMQDTFSLSSEFARYDSLYSFSLFDLSATFSTLQNFMNPSDAVSISLVPYIFSTVSESSSAVSAALNAGMLISELSPSMQFSSLLIQSSIFVQNSEFSRLFSEASTSDAGSLSVYQTEYTLEDNVSSIYFRESLVNRTWTNTLSVLPECASCSTNLEITESQNQLYSETFSKFFEVSQYDIILSKAALYSSLSEETNIRHLDSSYTENVLLSFTPQNTFYLASAITAPSVATAVEPFSTFTERQTALSSFQSELQEQLGNNISRSTFLSSTTYQQSDLTNVSLSAPSVFESGVTHTDTPVFQENDLLSLYSSLNMFMLPTLTKTFLSEVEKTPFLTESGNAAESSLEIKTTSVVSSQELDTISAPSFLVSNVDIFGSETTNFIRWPVSLLQSDGIDTSEESISTTYVSGSEGHELVSLSRNAVSLETMYSSSYYGTETLTHHEETADLTASLATGVLNSDKIMISPTEATINQATDFSLMESAYHMTSNNRGDYSSGIIPTETLQGVISPSDVITSISSFTEADISTGQHTGVPHSDVIASIFEDLSAPSFILSSSENNSQRVSETVLQTFSYMSVDQIPAIYSRNGTEIPGLLYTPSTAQAVQSENPPLISDFTLHETSILNPSSVSAFPEYDLLSSVMQQDLLMSSQNVITQMSLYTVETGSVKWMYESLSSSHKSAEPLVTLIPSSHTFGTNNFLNMALGTASLHSQFVMTTEVAQSSTYGNTEQEKNTVLTPEFTHSLESLTLFTYLISDILPTMTLPPSVLQGLTSTSRTINTEIPIDTYSISSNILQATTFLSLTSFSEFIYSDSISTILLSTSITKTFISIQVPSISLTTSSISVLQPTVMSSADTRFPSIERNTVQTGGKSGIDIMSTTFYFVFTPSTSVMQTSLTALLPSSSFSSRKDHSIYPSMQKSNDNFASSETLLFIQTSAFVNEVASFSSLKLEAELGTTFKVNATLSQTYATYLVDMTSKSHAVSQLPELLTSASVNITLTTSQRPAVITQETTFTSSITMIPQWPSSYYIVFSTLQTLSTHVTKSYQLQSTTYKTSSSLHPGDTATTTYTTTAQPQILVENILEMILRVNSSVDITETTFRQSVINGIQTTFIHALELQSRRKRRSIQDAITVYLQSVMRSATEDVIVQFAILQNGSALLASDAVTVFNKLPNFAEELSKNMNYQVVKAPYVAATKSSSSSSPSLTGWIIAVVLLAVACMVLLILLIFFVVKWCRKKSTSQREAEDAGKQERPMTSNALLKHRKHGIQDLEKGENEEKINSAPLILKYSESTKNISFAAHSGNPVLMRNNSNHTSGSDRIRKSDIQEHVKKKTDGNTSNDIHSQIISRQEHSFHTFSSSCTGNKNVTEGQDSEKEFIQGAEFEHVAQMNISTQSPKALSIPLRFKTSIAPLPPLKSQRLTVQETDSETEDSVDESLQTSPEYKDHLEDNQNVTDQVLVPKTKAKPFDNELQRKSEAERKRNKERLREMKRQSLKKRMEDEKQQSEKQEDGRDQKPKVSEDISKMKKKRKRKEKEINAWKKAQAQIASLLDSQPNFFRHAESFRNVQGRQTFPWRSNQVEEFKQNTQGLEMDCYDQGVIPPYASAPGWMLPSHLRSNLPQLPAEYITISRPLPYPWQAIPPPNTRHNAKFLRRIQGPVPHNTFFQEEESSSLGDSSSVPGSVLDESDYTGSGGADIPEMSSHQEWATQTRCTTKELSFHPGLPVFNPGSQDYFKALTSLNHHSGVPVPSKKSKKAKETLDSENSNARHSSEELIQMKSAVKSKERI